MKWYLVVAALIIAAAIVYIVLYPKTVANLIEAGRGVAAGDEYGQ
ncbi:MAG: hypothetical protein ACR2PA_06010 [Hyphomicrobiaceae bacterium]